MYHESMLITLVLIIIIGNIITLVAIAKNRSLHRKENALIASLAVADMMTGLLLVTNSVEVVLTFSKPVWNTIVLLATVAISVSQMHMVVIGVNRFIAVVMALRYRTLVSKKTTIVVVIMMWTMPVIFMVPLHMYAIRQDPLPSGVSFADWAFALNGMIWVALICLSLAILYGKIILETRAQSMKIQAWRLQQQPAPNIHGQNITSTSQSDSRKRSTRLVIIILSTAVILNLPYLIYSILVVNGTPVTTMHMSTLLMMAVQCTLTNAGINIFIYALFASNFRKAYKRMLCSGCQKRNEVNEIAT